MRQFNPFSVWTQVTIAFRTARVWKSVQYGTYSFGSGGVTATATITSVDTTRSVLVDLGFSVALGTATGGGSESVRVTLTNATTVTATRAQGTDAGGSPMVGTGSFVVMEGY